MGKKNPNQKQVMAVEIQASAEDSAAWYNPLEGGRNIQHRDHAYQPAVDVTIHHRDGTRQSRRQYVGEPHINRKAEAQAAAEKRALELAAHARSKGVQVIGNVAGNSKRRSQPVNTPSAEDRAVEKIIPWIIPVFLVTCSLGGLWLYNILP
jgi:hypothetical protein